MSSTITSLAGTPLSLSSISIPDTCSTSLGEPTADTSREAQLVPKPLASKNSFMPFAKTASNPAPAANSVSASTSALSSSPISASKSRFHYNCTICWRSFAPPCFTIGRAARVVCVDCWRYVFSIGICWTCGEIVFRRTDAISFGWCWWHWGCFSCLVCSVLASFLICWLQVLTKFQSPLPPPTYLTDSGDVHEKGILLHEPPLCVRCSTSASSLPQLEQHSKVLHLANTDSPRSVEAISSPRTALRLSLSEPLNPQRKFASQDELKPMPRWMELLPSNRRPQPTPIQRHPFLCSSSSISLSRTVSGSTESEYLTAPECLAVVDFIDDFEAAKSQQNRNELPHIRNRTISSAVDPKIRNARCAAFPRYPEKASEVDESSTTSSRGSVLMKIKSRDGLRGSLESTEFLDKYRAKSPAVPSVEPYDKPLTRPICPICANVVNSPDSIKRSPNNVYHRHCFVCCVCGQDNSTLDEHMDDYQFLTKLPYHKRCLSAESKPLAERLKQIRPPVDGESVEPSSPAPSAINISHKRSLIIGAQPARPIASTVVPIPKRKVSLTSSATGMLGASNGFMNEVSSFFANRKRQFKSRLPSFAGASTGTGTICAACNKEIMTLEKVNGPSKTVLHRTCMACNDCGKVVREGNDAKWYDWGETGLMEPSCRVCWRERRRERGMSEERIDEEEGGCLGLEMEG